MALVPLNDVLAFLELAADDSFGTISALQSGVEKLVKTYCRRDFEETTYTEVYSGTGSTRIFLNQMPITSVIRIGTGTWAPAYIYNSNVYTTAIVSVFSDKITLAYDNGVVSSLAYATYPTLSSLIDKVNTLGNGWVGVINSTNYNGIITTEFIARYGIDAINSQNAELLIPLYRLNDVQIDARLGCLFRPSGFFPSNLNSFPDFLPINYTLYNSRATDNLNLYITYKAGYLTIPEDLKYAVKVWCKDMYARHQGDEFGLSSYRIENLSKTFEDVPTSVKIVLDKYKRVMI